MEDALRVSFSYSSCNHLCYEEERIGILYMLNLGCLAAVQLPRQLIYLTFSTNLAAYSEWVLCTVNPCVLCDLKMKGHVCLQHYAVNTFTSQNEHAQLGNGTVRLLVPTRLL